MFVIHARSIMPVSAVPACLTFPPLDANRYMVGTFLFSWHTSGQIAE
jgi:hypothetical protein